MYDVIGDVHGCLIELRLMLHKLGYEYDGVAKRWRHPENRQLVFVGDLNDRGPDTARVFELAIALKAAGVAHFVMGNHEWKALKLMRAEFEGKISPGGPPKGDLVRSLQQCRDMGSGFYRSVYQFLNQLPTKFETPELIVVHAAYKEGVTGGAARDLNIYGETSGKKTAEGYPERLENWKLAYEGDRTIVVGHEPLHKEKKRAEQHHRFGKNGANIYNIDFGCCFGGDLAAYRYPEDELVLIPAGKVYWKRDK